MFSTMTPQRLRMIAAVIRQLRCSPTDRAMADELDLHAHELEEMKRPRGPRLSVMSELARMAERKKEA